MLLITVLTITVLIMLCVTSLYITSQNANAGMQAASWQQALSGAESAVDQAIAALNTNNWTNWVTLSGSLPNLQPQPGPTPTVATGPPGSGQYVYLSNSITSQLPQYNVANAITTSGEGNNLVSMWTTIDTGGLPLDSNSHQWYRIRATGTAAAVGPPRVSNQRLDNDLRKIGLRFDRKTNNAIASPQATRTIEVIVQALAQSIWLRGVTVKGTITMSGGGIVDSFNSSDPFKSTNGQYDVTKRQSHGDIATINSGTNSDLNSTYVYGNLAYSGSAVKNTTHVQGTISTPFNTTIPATSDPTTFSAPAVGSVPPISPLYTTSTGNPPPATITVPAGTSSTAPAQIKINGQFQLSGSNVLNINAPAGATAANPAYLTIWVTDQWQTSGTSVINQSPYVIVTWYVDNQIQLSGSSYNNQSGKAANVNFVGVGTNQQAQVSGSGSFIGTINAPGFNVQVSGSGSYVGALIANSLAISGSGGVHYDEALNTNSVSSAIGNYAFASWFEDSR